MQKFNLARRLFDIKERSSDGGDSDWTSVTEDVVKKIGREVTSSLIHIGGRKMTTGGMEEEMTAGTSTARTDTSATPKLDHECFDEKEYCAPPSETLKTRIELCKTLLFFTEHEAVPER